MIFLCFNQRPQKLVSESLILLEKVTDCEYRVIRKGKKRALNWRINNFMKKKWNIAKLHLWICVIHFEIASFLTIKVEVKINNTISLTIILFILINFY